MSRKVHSSKTDRITIADVAREAQVSPATVSFVLNRTPGQTISLGTRMRVIEASRALGYLPNPNARALGKGYSDEIANISFEPVKSYGMLEWLTFTQQRTQQLGYTPGTYLYYGSSPDAMIETYLGILARRPAGIMTTRLLMTKEIYKLTKRMGVRACVILSPTPVDYVPTLILPYQEGGQLAGLHFVERGHKCVAFIEPISPTPLRLEVSQVFLRGMQSVLSQSDVTVIRFPMDPTLESARETVGKILGCKPKPTAVFGFTDDYCLRLHKAIQECGLRMPDDLALVGSEDTELSSLVHPTLTALRFDIQALAFQWVDRVDALIREQKFSPELLTPPPSRLIIRESS